MNDLVKRLRRGTLVWVHDDGTETWEAPHIAMTEAADEIELLEKANAQLRHIVETEQDITEEEALLREIDRELEDVEYLGSYVDGIKALKAEIEQLKIQLKEK